MKRIAGTAVLFAVLTIVAGAAMAQEEPYLRTPHRVHAFVHGGIAIPAQPGAFKSYWNAALPFTIGAGAPIFPWMDINGMYSYISFGNNQVKTKQRVNIVGVPDVSGGTANTSIFWGSVRFLAIPNSRANPFFEVGVGYFTTNMDDLEIEDIDYVATIPNTKGVSYSFGGGLQYAINERWSSYVKYYWTMNKDDQFQPENLVRSPQDALIDGASQQYSSLVVGMLIRI